MNERARSAEEVLALLEAAGRALASGANDAPVDTSDLDAADVEAALAGSAFDLAALEDAAIGLAALARGEDGDPPSTPGDVDANALVVRDALRARDRVEHVLLGAERVLRAPPVLGRDAEVFVVAFDTLVRPSLHRLTAWNDVRAEHARLVAPPLRDRFWWSCTGASIAPTAAQNLSSVADLIATFPAARAELESLIDTAKELRAASPSARVVTLRAWSKRARAVSLAPSRLLPVAAATQLERIDLASTPHYDLSWRLPAALVVDLHVEPAPGATPFARLPSGRVLTSVLVPRTIHRYTIALDDEALGGDQLVVVLPLATGATEIRVPPADAVAVRR